MHYFSKNIDLSTKSSDQIEKVWESRRDEIS
jgi:hypothetical protein